MPDERDNGLSNAQGARTAALRAKLAALPLLESIEPHLLGAIAAQFEWFSLPGGQILFREGDEDDSLYVVLSGRLGAFLRNDHGKEILIRQMVSGETVGEMALLSGERRSAMVLAMRNTELVRLSKSAFTRLIDEHPRALRFVTDLLVRRLRDSPRLGALPEPPGTVAVIPLHPATDAAGFVRSFVRAFDELGLKACALDNASSGRSMEWFNSLEETHQMVLYQSDLEPSAWTRLCLRQADLILLLADASQPTAEASPAIWPMLASQRAPVELVIFRASRFDGPPKTKALLDRFDMAPHHHVREGVARDLRRLARMITGRAIGVVMSGGGARAFAHLGVLKALREAGMELDLFGGASMGSIVAGGAALEWDDRELGDRMRAAFSDVNPISDYTFPLISLSRGRKASHLLRENFGERLIEDCPCSFFCVSSNLTTSEVKVHRTGPLWLATRSSIAIPGVLPPVVEGSDILIDGGTINNLPIDVMREMRRGPIIAMDVSRAHALRATIDELDDRSLWQLFGHARSGTPNILTLLVSAGTVSSMVQVKLLRSQVDILIEPDLPDIGMLDWKSFHAVVESGYRYTIDLLEKKNGQLFASDPHP